MPLSPTLTAWKQLTKNKGWELHDALAGPMWRCRLGTPRVPGWSWSEWSHWPVGSPGTPCLCMQPGGSSGLTLTKFRLQAEAYPGAANLCWWPDSCYILPAFLFHLSALLLSFP